MHVKHFNFWDDTNVLFQYPSDLVSLDANHEPRPIPKICTTKSFPVANLDDY